MAEPTSQPASAAAPVSKFHVFFLPRTNGMIVYVLICASTLLAASAYLYWNLRIQRLSLAHIPFTLPICVGLFLLVVTIMTTSSSDADASFSCHIKMLSWTLWVVLSACFPILLARPTRPSRVLLTVLILARSLWALNAANLMMLCLPPKVNFVAQKRGKTVILCESAHNNDTKLLSIGPHWSYAIITLVTIVGVSAGFVAYFLKEHVNSELVTVSIAGSASTVLSFLLLFFRDAGTVVGYMVTKAPSQGKMWSYCDRCATFRPQRTIHCSDCQVCIENYDHHCPWTGKCVGKTNIAFFHMFVTLLLATLAYNVTLCIVVAARRLTHPHLSISTMRA
ncbi:hypothetical protein EBZ80_20075 [bacterium]|nr:hypothetical protein [bacterium]